MAHAEREDEALERNFTPPPDRLEQVAHRGLAVAFDFLELDLVVARFQREDIGGLLHPFLLEEEFDLLFAEAVDVEGATRGEQLQVLDLLVGTGELAGAAGARPLFPGRGLLAHHIGVQRARALLRELKRLRILRPLVEDDIDHLRNYVAGALHDDGVADPDVATVAQLLAVAADALDVVLVVQRHVLHDDAADTGRLELADRRKRAGAPDLDLDVAEHGHGALGREFMRDRPARRARHEAEPFLPVDPIHLVDDAVNVVVEFGALFLDLAVEGDQLLDRMTKLGQRIGLEAAALEPTDHAGLRRLRHRAHLAPGIGEKAERTRGGDGRILLPQGARRRIARIGEDRVAGGLLPLVQREKGVLGHVDLAAHLANLRHVAAFQLLGHVLEGADIGGYVLTLRAIAAGRGGDQLTALVAQRHRQSVDLRLGGKIDLVVVTELEKTTDAAGEFEHVLLGERVVERQHRQRVADLLEASRRRGTDFLRRRFRGDEFRKAGFDGIEALAQRVIFG